MSVKRSSFIPWVSNQSIAGAGFGLLAAIVIVAILPAALPVRLLAGLGLLAAGYLGGFARAARSRMISDAGYIQRLRAELRHCQDHIASTGSFRSLGAWIDAASGGWKESLHGLVGAARGLAMDSAIPDEARQAAGRAADQAGALQGSLGPLTSYALATPSKAPFNLNNLLRESIDLCRHRAEEKAIRFEERYAVIPPVFGPAGRVQSALLNVIINAVESMPHGGGTITIQTTHEGDRVVGRVRDTGIGIKPEHLQRVFEPFFTTKPDRGGAGLGLWETRDTLDRIGATLGIASVPHEGTEVAFSFPQAAPLAAGRAGTPLEELPRNTADEGDRRIA